MIKKRSEIAAMALAVTMAASALLTGCGGEDSASTPGSASDTTQQESKTEENTDKQEAENTSGSTEKTKITMVTYLGNPSRDALIQELVAGLDDIELEIISPPSDQALQKISTMLQTGEGIDIVEVDSVPVNHIANGFMEPLDSYLESWEDWGSVSEYLKDQLATYDGHIYSVPYGVYERALFYRKDWFEEKNLSVPGTWEELYNVAVELTDSSQNRYGYSFRGGAGTGGFAEMTILSFIAPEKIDSGLSFLTRDGKSMFDQPEAVEALDLYKRLYEDASHPDSIAWGYPEMVEAFYSGTAAMLIQDPEVIATCEEYMEEGTWDVAPLPTGPSGQALFGAGFAGWGIASGSENKEAAWEVIKALSSEEGNTTFCKKNGNIPIHTTAQEDPFFSEGYYGCYIEMAANPDSYVGYVPGGEYRYASEEEKEQMSEYEATRDATVQEMLLGQITPEECAAKFASCFTWLEDSAWVKERFGR
nr:sugar ABC transporter substrate-binding protein [uncultured Acetatifactor sp.]